MARLNQSSFRRILLSRILLVSVPVLLIGEAITFRKARSSLLETAQQNLTESAVRKGESISEAIASLKATLLMASQTSVLQTGTAKNAQQFLNQLAAQQPKIIQCIQLTDIQTNNIVASTCRNNRIISNREYDAWPQQQAQFITPQIHIKPLLERHVDKTKITRSQCQLQLVLSAPVYNNARQLRYALSFESALQHKKRESQVSRPWWYSPGSLAGSTLVIYQNGTILVHPIAERVGRNIQQEVAAIELQSIVNKPIAEQQDFTHLSFAQNGVEFLAGYTAIASPISNNPNQRWIILAVTRLDNVLFALREIKLILFVLTIGLLGASLLATLYLARDLARPVEELRDYALNLQSHHAAERVPHNFKIREFQQLAEALDNMVERLKAWADEIEKAWEEAQAANDLKNEFLATTSHELRTPLNAIIGCVRLVRDGCCDDREEEMEFLERADVAAIHLLGIINDLLDVAKIEAGKLSVVMEPIDLCDVLKEVINLQSVQIQQKGLQLIVPDWQEAILVQADPAKLKQVLINVIGNAVKFTHEGSITIKTIIESVAAQDNSPSISRVVVTVQDTGVGVAPDQQHKLFRPFVMVDGTTTRNFGGTGLGLAISRNLIELMGGSIMLCSAGSGQGTTVAIAMPILNVSPLRSDSVVGESLVFNRTSYMAGAITDQNTNTKR
ncbi:MAG: two-component sensor histidine kinase [Gloeocapsa sp. UFS-A4-WI-NPMV-4B04]|jgi:signal transduction histidine kinase|nr:two-component sensor histidine kinase [Gloeocapsa sp. UFS-A4-WI-NPMV-4B04]